jgi:hypothetical protein
MNNKSKFRIIIKFLASIVVGGIFASIKEEFVLKYNENKCSF